MSRFFTPLFQKEQKIHHHILSAILIALLGVHTFLGIDYVLGAGKYIPKIEDAIIYRPSPIADVRVRAHKDLLYISWAAPVSDDPLVGYIVQYKDESDSEYQTLVEDTGKDISCLLRADSRFEANHVYSIRVAAKTKTAIGIYSQPVKIHYNKDFFQ